MHKRFCDRCHKEITRENTYGAYKVERHKNYADTDVDLCDPCLSALEDWLSVDLLQSPAPVRWGFFSRFGL